MPSLDSARGRWNRRMCGLIYVKRSRNIKPTSYEQFEHQQRLLTLEIKHTSFFSESNSVEYTLPASSRSQIRTVTIGPQLHFSLCQIDRDVLVGQWWERSKKSDANVTLSHTSNSGPRTSPPDRCTVPTASQTLRLSASQAFFRVCTNIIRNECLLWVQDL
jgi:hypothetical protein